MEQLRSTLEAKVRRMNAGLRFTPTTEAGFFFGGVSARVELVPFPVFVLRRLAARLKAGSFHDMAPSGTAEAVP
jgi:hypothetical protein